MNIVLSKIKEEIDYFNSQIEDDDCLNHNYMVYQHWFWVRVGQKIGWEPLTLALYYFQNISDFKIVKHSI